jgi:hypothetical protein
MLIGLFVRLCLEARAVRQLTVKNESTGRRSTDGSQVSLLKIRGSVHFSYKPNEAYPVVLSLKNGALQAEGGHLSSTRLD